jgi:hypothetical protein
VVLPYYFQVIIIVVIIVFMLLLLLLLLFCDYFNRSNSDSYDGELEDILTVILLC